MYAAHLDIANVYVGCLRFCPSTLADLLTRKSATIDPPELADQKLPKRVVDYAFVLRPNQLIRNAWEALQPVGKAGIKSWNHTTNNDVRSTPIAINIETKAPNKSWTDGKA